MYSHFLSYFKRESFSAPTIFSAFHFEKQIILYNFHFLYIYFFLSTKKNCSTKRKSHLYYPYRITSLSVSGWIFTQRKMAVELFSHTAQSRLYRLLQSCICDECAWYITLWRTFDQPRLATTYVHAFISNNGLHVCTCIPLQQRH